MYCKKKFSKFNLTKNNLQFYQEVDKKAFLFKMEANETEDILSML